MAGQEQPTLNATLESLIARISKYRGRAIGEQNTKAGLIEPLLESLGWDTRDLDEVHREYRAKPTDNPVDYALQMLRKPPLYYPPRLPLSEQSLPCLGHFPEFSVILRI